MLAEPLRTTVLKDFIQAIYVYKRIAVCVLTGVLWGNWDIAVGSATCYELDDWEVGVRVPVRSRIFASPYRSDRLWGPPSLLFNR
jgi:hypothetical protein